ncbi:vezatin [Chanos chanos]|uniref:Vezatin n=1 Tax=Chanos chanos TaxID=29144 RepID=A0A6J2WWI5_CHACN|nr:vezatin [Chanos chanos]
MVEDIDEEVVFENSPLFQYLQDLGHTDFEACCPVSQAEKLSAGGEETPLPQDILPTPKRGGIWKLVDAMHSLNPLRQHIGPHKEQRQLDTEFRQYSLRCILSQDVLLQEDVELIELLDPSALPIGSNSTVCPSAASVLPAPRYFSPPSAWDLSVLVGLVAVLLAVWCTCVESEQVVLWIGVCIVGVLCACRAMFLWQKAGLQRYVQSQAVQLEQIVSNSRALTNLTRKALRLIQETEVISRGFTLLFDRVSAACPLNRAGQQRSQQLIGLRKAVYRSLRCAFRSSRLATCIMLSTFPLNSEIDNVTNYVSTVPLGELGLGLGPECLSDEQIQEITDDFSLPALKMLFQLWVGQSSEFFRRLVLLLSPAREDQSPAPNQFTYCIIALVTGSLHHTLDECLDNLQRSYDFHRYFQVEHQPQGSERRRKAQQTSRELSTLHTSVRSLQLHLKALLNEVIILEDELEKLMVAKETEEMTPDSYQELQEHLQLLQPHMQASTCCWDSMLEQVKKITHISICSGNLSSPEKEVATTDTVSPTVVTHIEDKDPVPQEQELEAYASDSDTEADLGGMSDLLSPWERERQRQEREESRRVLLELKSVLGFRASEGERDKRKLLLFNDQAALTPVSTEATESHKTPENPDLTESTSDQDLLSKPQKEEGQVKEKERESQEYIEERGGGQAYAGETEFCCGESLGESASDDAECQTEGEAQLYQSDGLMSMGSTRTESQLLTHSVPKLSVIDRLTELHGSAALSFSSALAAQVAAHSHSFTQLCEHTYGDSEEEEEGEKEEEEENVALESRKLTQEGN